MSNQTELPPSPSPPGDPASPDPLTARLAQRLRALRRGAGWSLEVLAARSGVSRSMISQVERGASSPTAAVLDRLAQAFGLALAALFDAPEPAADPVARAADHPPWRDPASGYVRRNVSPALAGLGARIVDVTLPPGARVVYENGGGAAAVRQQVWVIDGRLAMRWGDTTWTLDAGDCAAMALDRPTGFHNPGQRAVRYAVVVSEATP